MFESTATCRFLYTPAVRADGPPATGCDAPANGAGGPPRAAALLGTRLPPGQVRLRHLDVGCHFLTCCAQLPHSKLGPLRVVTLPSSLFLPGNACKLAALRVCGSQLARLPSLGCSLCGTVCRFGYQSLEQVQQVVAAYAAAGLPLESIWTDIDLRELRSTGARVVVAWNPIGPAATLRWGVSECVLGRPDVPLVSGG